MRVERLRVEGFPDLGCFRPNVGSQHSGPRYGVQGVGFRDWVYRAEGSGFSAGVWGLGFRV